MPHMPDPQQGDCQEGEFADLFARRARTPLRGFLPGRRVWSAVGGSAAAVLVIAGSASVVSAIDWSSGDSDKVTTAADKEAPQAKAHADTAEKPTDTPSEKEEDSGKKSPEVVYVPVSGGTGAGAAASTSNSGPTDSTEGASGSTGSKEEQSSSPTNGNAQSGTTTSYLWSDGSVDMSEDNAYWDQSVVTVKSTKSLSSLKVVIKIIQTGGVAGTGTWSNLGDKVSVATGASSGELDYVVTLKSGNTLDPGTYVFKFQYNHDQGNRDAGGDRYNVTAVATDSDDEFRSGGF
ncbi:hypothetical protein ACWCQQ_03675 [Streptomyces sp. NPDC002143]